MLGLELSLNGLHQFPRLRYTVHLRAEVVNLLPTMIPKMRQFATGVVWSDRIDKVTDSWWWGRFIMIFVASCVFMLKHRPIVDRSISDISELSMFLPLAERAIPTYLEE